MMVILILKVLVLVAFLVPFAESAGGGHHEHRVKIDPCPLGARPLMSGGGVNGTDSRPVKCLPRNTNMCINALNQNPTKFSGEVCCWHNKIDYFCCVNMVKEQCPSYKNVTVVIHKGIPKASPHRLYAFRKLLPTQPVLRSTDTSYQQPRRFHEVAGNGFGNQQLRRATVRRNQQSQRRRGSIPRLFVHNNMQRSGQHFVASRQQQGEGGRGATQSGFVQPTTFFRQDDSQLIQPFVVATPEQGHNRRQPVNRDIRRFGYNPAHAASSYHQYGFLPSASRAHRVVVKPIPPVPVNFVARDNRPVHQKNIPHHLQTVIHQPVRQEAVRGPVRRYLATIPASGSGGSQSPRK